MLPENKLLKSTILIYWNTIAIHVIIIWFGDIILIKLHFFDGAASKIGISFFK